MTLKSSVHQAKRATAPKKDSGDVAAPSDTRRWSALALLSAASFMVILAGSIVNVALPSIQTALGFSQENLQWLVSGYSLTFGAFLLLAGRAADLFGRRLLFMVGMVLFTLASLLAGFAGTELTLILARALQGVGGALLTPAALSLVTTTFAEGPERNRALGIYGALAALGFAAGVLLGGILTDGLGWRWVFFVNIPVGMLAVGFTPALLRESRIEADGKQLDLAGAITVAAALAALVYGVSQAERAGFGSAQALAPIGVALLLFAAFVVIERHVRAPLVRLDIFRLRTLTGANLVGLLLPGTFGAALFILTLYFQNVLGYSAIEAGLAFLPMALTVLVASNVASRWAARVGVKALIVTGTLVMVLGLLLLTRVSPESYYLADLLPAMLVVALGFGTAINATIIAAVTGVEEDEQGLASGLINTSTQVGAAVIVAVLAVVAATRTDTLLGVNELATVQEVALTQGYVSAFATGAGLVALSTFVALFVMQRKEASPASQQA